MKHTIQAEKQDNGSIRAVVDGKVFVVDIKGTPDLPILSPRSETFYAAMGADSGRVLRQIGKAARTA